MAAPTKTAFGVILIASGLCVAVGGLTGNLAGMLVALFAPSKPQYLSQVSNSNSSGPNAVGGTANASPAIAGTGGVTPVTGTTGQATQSNNNTVAT